MIIKQVILLLTLLIFCVPAYAQEITPAPTGCWDPPPGGSVELKTASPSGEHDITLTWTPASGPVSYYLLSYGIASGQYIYGNPDMGGQGTTTYTVGGLTKGKTYYFVVRAGNGCTPGTFSNELSAVAGETPTPTPSPTETPSPTPTPETPAATPTPTPEPEVLAAETYSAPDGKNSLIGYIMLAATALGILCAVAGAVMYLFSGTVSNSR